MSNGENVGSPATPQRPLSPRPSLSLTATPHQERCPDRQRIVSPASSMEPPSSKDPCTTPYRGGCSLQRSFGFTIKQVATRFQWRGLEFVRFPHFLERAPGLYCRSFLDRKSP